VANRDIYLYNSIASTTASGPVGYDDWVFNILGATPTPTQLADYYTARLGTAYATQALATQAMATSWFRRTAANGYENTPSLTAPGGICAAVYYTTVTPAGWWVYYRPTTAKRTLYINTFYP